MARKTIKKMGDLEKRLFYYSSVSIFGFLTDFLRFSCSTSSVESPGKLKNKNGF
jgi:hypothetical protein